MTFKKISLIVMIATASLIAGFLYHQLSLSNNNSQTDLLYELNLTDSKEQKKDLAQYKNDWLMINFWATWCAPCREEIPELNDFFQSENIRIFSGLGLRFIHKKIYNAVFRIDYGYGITRNESKGIVFGIGQYF